MLFTTEAFIEKLKRLPQHVIDSSSVNVFKSRLDEAWEDMGIYSWEATSLINYNYKYKYGALQAKKVINNNLWSCVPPTWNKRIRYLRPIPVRQRVIFKTAVLVYGSVYTEVYLHDGCRLGSPVVSVLDSGAEAPGFKSQSRRCRVTVLGKLFTPSCLCSPSSKTASSPVKGCGGNCRPGGK